MVGWIAADWGTSRLRIWAMQGEQVLDRRQSDDGMGRLAPEDFEPAFLRLAGDWIDGVTDVLVCGMAGARGGWSEAGYRAVPCTPADAGQATLVATADPRLRVRILPGLSQAAPPDVMRGEETQIAGLLADALGWTGTICLPGTHSKWVRVEDGRVTEFQTFMTGELFALISEQSVLRLTVSGRAGMGPVFLRAVAGAMADPAAAMGGLFALRAGALLHGDDPQAASRLSGLLIGLELAGARRFLTHDPVTLVCDPRLGALYAAALGTQGVAARLPRAEDLTLKGLTTAHLDTPR